MQRVAGMRIPELSEKAAVERTPTVVLLGCTKGKNEGRHPARELYKGRLWDARMAYVKASGCRAFVLSAKHGVISLDDEIDWYDHAASQMKAEERKVWAQMIDRQLHALGGVKRVVIMAGASYFAPLVKQLGGRIAVETPMRGLSIGDQYRVTMEMAKCG